MKIFRNFTILICVLFFSQLARGQNVAEPRITIHLDSARFNDFVKDVERQTGYFFYYDAARFDSLTIDLDVKDQTIRTVLDQVFRGSDFTYALDAGKRVYITEGQKIITQLQPGLFNP
ncbi:MAG: STN domain-containing protein, partial [Dyadobacter sp.]